MISLQTCVHREEGWGKRKKEGGNNVGGKHLSNTLTEFMKKLKFVKQIWNPLQQQKWAICLPHLPCFSQAPLHIHSHSKEGLWSMRLNTCKPPKPFIWEKLFLTCPVHAPKGCNRLLNGSRICELSPIQFGWADVYWTLPRCSAEKSMASGAKMYAFKFRFCQFDKLTLSHFFSFLTRKIGNSNIRHLKIVEY